ncbi:MAG: arylsulfatase [Planctomycetota bacterium]|mgnify:CR=1 FL=1|nr:MAG: arylsulfatase [Planctomycetota bacterium]REK38699.1 MAG: arylsulfatase [Planctomycetota bacterium]
MNRIRARTPLFVIALTWLLLVNLSAAAQRAAADDDSLPNIVVIFTDDQGYADVGCFGAEGYRTPHLDQMAKEGRRFTSFYSAAPACSGSRVSLMTGSYYARLHFPLVLFPGSKVGLAAGEMTLAELVKQKGYATACVGKWHLGHQEKFLPTQHGFDRYLGIPYSNDMTIDPKTRLAEGVVLRNGMTRHQIRWEKPRHDWVPLVRNNEVVEYPANQATLTRRYTEEAVRFIDENAERPFLLYLPHTMPHTPLFTAEEFTLGAETRYGDVIEEIDWSVGQILDALKKNNIDENTLVIFTTDNGPWLSFGNHAGKATPLREGKGTTFEGGMRVPCIMRWPARIPADSECNVTASTIDLVPTVAAIIDGQLPEHRLDGKNILPLMTSAEPPESPHEYFCYYKNRDLEAIRSGPWKLHFRHLYFTIVKPGHDGSHGVNKNKMIELSLYNLERDIGETTNVAAEYPHVVARLRGLADRARLDIGDNLTGHVGENSRRPDPE